MSEGPLAIEGHKRLESAQQELFDAFSACFKKVNNRNVDTFQPHEMIMLCNDACFFDLVESIRREIELLSGEETEPVSDVAGLMALLKARMVHLDGDVTTGSLADPLFRTEVLGELLVDLQSCRLATKKICTTELRLELTDWANQESRPIIERIGQAFGVRVTAKKGGGKGAYKGKAAAGTAAGAAAGDERVAALEQIAEAVEGDAELCSRVPYGLLYPEWDVSGGQEVSVNEMIELFNKEYTTRRKVLTRRLDVTIQAFLWSAKADKHSGQISQVVAAVMDWRDHLGAANIGKWHMLAAGESITEEPPKVSSTNAISSVVKQIIIGAVPDRGGVPEGYTVEDIAKDIVKANVALTRKDGGGGGRGAGASAQAAAAMASKRWVGQGMGGGDVGANGDTGGGGAQGAYYSKGGGGKGSGDKGGGGGGYYSQQSGGKGGGGGGKGGGGGGYYSQQSSKGDSGGYPGGKGGGGGGGYYGQQADSGGDGGGKGGGRKGGGGRGGGGGGFYAQQGGGGGGGYYGGGDTGGCGGGGAAGGGYYSAQGGGAGGGGFYAQQDAGAGGGGGGFYAAQQGGAAGGFYGQQGGGGGGFYAQQGGGAGAGAGGFYAQQAGGGGGGFYAQQGGGGGGGGGGFYAQGGGGGGFYDQGGGGKGGGGKGGGRGGGGGWGGRQSDLPPTAQGWSKGGRR